MLKINKNSDLLTFPATSSTPIRFERSCGGTKFFTIISVASIKDQIFALLENNVDGEEDMILVKLPKDPYIIRFHSGEPLRAHLNKNNYEGIFLTSNSFIASAYGDPIEEMLVDEYCVEDDEIEVWLQAEIDVKL